MTQSSIGNRDINHLLCSLDLDIYWEKRLNKKYPLNIDKQLKINDYDGMLRFYRNILNE